MKQPIISLCIPTYGISEWVFPVLDSIYSQNVDNSLFEVIITDNGNNSVFSEKMLNYSKNNKNLTYKKTDAYLFDNQLEALKIANGLFLKFINHREIMTKGSIEYLISVIQNNVIEKPVIYFANGTLKNDFYKLNTFDDFVKTLGRLASWTSGVGIWKEDYLKIPKDKKFDKISPHSQILFSERHKNNYLIDNFNFANDIVSDHSKKGKYDLFKAFAVEELTITLNLFIDGDISAKTLKYVKHDYKKFVSSLYCDFCILKHPCSYDLSGFDDAMGIFYTKKVIKFYAYLFLIKRIFGKIKTILSRRK